ncbi:hypothetical protein MMAG44476_27118 [Mycolicibacterium mageritense DSM 44476 = CIP 104973]|jgi:hypothetical protein|uniref:Uncharacterized protein n=1 Tax=Mycolicibacterium canariasense TaxID=228230 RepID=A0A100WEN4_MYCCR|nr:uncharacterized protein RMCC_3756 [Mycolicibacterium canariasense]
MSTTHRQASGSRRTDVYPLAGGEAVSYSHCEVDEVDREGCLRIATYGDPPAGEGTPVYVVWAPGSWQRAETVAVSDVSSKASDTSN